MKDKLLQEAIDFMLSETEKHDKSWKGMTTEEWMVAFAKEQMMQFIKERTKRREG